MTEWSKKMKKSNKKVPNKKVPEMKISRFIIEQVLEVYFDGNKSECAREMQMEYPEFQRHMRLIGEGASSNKTMEATLLLCGLKRVDLNAILESFVIRYRCADLAAEDNFCEDTLGKLLAEMENHRIHETNCLNVKKTAERLLKYLIGIFCSRDCKYRCQDDRDCVCRHFTKFLDLLREFMKEVERSLCAEIDAGAAVDPEGKAGEDSVEGDV
jgi:hypothetical protein